MSQDRRTVLHNPDPASAKTKREINAKGMAAESWLCVDCGVNTAPGMLTRQEIEMAFALFDGNANLQLTDEQEIYTVTEEVWQATGLAAMGGCLCIGCLEKRIGRRLKPKDFMPDHPFNAPDFPATRRLRNRRGNMFKPLGGPFKGNTIKEEPPPCQMVADLDGLFIIFNGMKIARRADPDTPQAKTWVSLEPGYQVLDNADMTVISVYYNGKQVH